MDPSQLPLFLFHCCNRIRNQHDRPDYGDDNYSEAHELRQKVWPLSIGVSIAKKVGSAWALECHGFHRVRTPFTTLFLVFISIISTSIRRAAQPCKSNAVVTFVAAGFGAHFPSTATLLNLARNAPAPVGLLWCNSSACAFFGFRGSNRRRVRAAAEIALRTGDFKAL